MSGVCCVIANSKLVSHKKEPVANVRVTGVSLGSLLVKVQVILLKVITSVTVIITVHSPAAKDGEPKSENTPDVLFIVVVQPILKQHK